MAAATDTDHLAGTACDADADRDVTGSDDGRRPPDRDRPESGNGRGHRITGDQGLDDETDADPDRYVR